MPFKAVMQSNFERKFARLHYMMNKAKAVSSPDIMAAIFFEAYGPSYRLEAADIIFKQVYAKYTPKEYDRTFALYRAPMMELRGNKVTLMLDLNDELKAEGSGTHEYYPKYVIFGVSQWQVPNYKPRNWYRGRQGWVQHFGRKFARDLRKILLRRIKP